MNAFTKVLAKIGSVIEWPFVHAAQLIKTLDDGLKDEPAVKSAVIGLVEQIETITADSAVAVAARGLDLADDMQTVSDAEKLWSYVTSTFLPAVENAYSDLKQDLDIPDPASPSTLPVATEHVPVAAA